MDQYRLLLRLHVRNGIVEKCELVLNRVSKGPDCLDCMHDFSFWACNFKYFHLKLWTVSRRNIMSACFWTTVSCLSERPLITVERRHWFTDLQSWTTQYREVESGVGNCEGLKWAPWQWVLILRWWVGDERALIGRRSVDWYRVFVRDVLSSHIIILHT